MKFKNKFLSITFILSLSCQLQAQVTNGGFETNLNGWTTSGAVEVLSASNFTPNVGPFEGSSFALLSTGPFDNGGGDTGNDIDASGSNEFDVATLSQTFNTIASGTLTFTLAGFATSEFSENIDDIFEVKLNGTPVIQGSVPEIVGSSFADFGILDGVSYVVTSGGITNGSRFNDGVTSAQQFSFNLSAGTHTLEFFIGDEDDDLVDSGLLIDDVKFVAPPTTVQNIPSLSALGLFILVLSVGLVGARSSRRS